MPDPVFLRTNRAPRRRCRRLLRPTGGAWLLATGVWLALAAPAVAQYAELGRVRFDNSGASAAQDSFLQGVAALHSFWYGEARILFREAQAADPSFALAYWGEAMTYDQPLWDGQDAEAARAALDRLAPTAAERSIKAPTQREREWLAAAEVLFGEESSRPARRHAYAERMLRLANAYPDDFEASAFYALALLADQQPGLAGIRQRMRAAAILERLMDAQPRHPGVLHYMIHAYDDPIHAPLGLRAALVYADVAPGSSHALHMPGHIFLQLGLWPKMVESNEASYLASLAWVKRRGLSPTERDFHSLSWLSYGYLQLGRRAEAEECVRLAQQAADQTGDSMVTTEARWMRARYLIESRQWSKVPAASDVEAGGDPYTEASMRLALALAAADRRDEAAAGAAARRLEELRAAREVEGNRYLERLLAIMAREAEAATELAAGRLEAALGKAREAVALEDTTDPSAGPPETLQPSYELLGDLLLAADRPAEAVEAYQRSLERAPNRVAALLGMARAATAQGDAVAAAAQYRQLLGFWQQADDDLPALAEARRAVAAAPAGGPTP
ncbi:MAG: hypothetical protein KDD11_19380 [Acidobacteria bacterium]|nr:hypothetical protein [Acidobacteriota bacterium]